MLVVPLWLFLRLLDFGAKALGRWLRLSPRRDDKVGAGGLRLPTLHAERVEA
jgi:hypothetical protein